MNKYMKPNRSEPKKSRGDYLWEWIQVVGWLFVLGMIYSMACKGKARAEDSVHDINLLRTDSISQPTTKCPTPADVLRGSLR
jgi:hypothetical protein